jgi:hypothetical protein
VEIKKAFDENRLFLNLELQIRDFLELWSKRYEARFLAFQKIQSGIAQGAVQKLDEFRRSIPDASVILRTFVRQRTYLKIPVRGGPASDVHATISGICHYAATHPLDRSVTETVFNYFGNPNNPDLVAFTAQVAKFMRTDPEVDFFRQFLMGDHPLHVFLFYSEVREIGSADLRGRSEFLTARFGRCGWGNIPRNKKRSYESQYCSDTQKFPFFCIALYNFCITQIEAEIAHVDQTDIEYAAQNMLSLSPSELFEAAQFLKSIAMDNKVGLKELAVLLFRRNVEFEHMLSGFEATQSTVLLNLEAFGTRRFAQTARLKKLVVHVSKLPKVPCVGRPDES